MLYKYSKQTVLVALEKLHFNTSIEISKDKGLFTSILNGELRDTLDYSSENIKILSDEDCTGVILEREDIDMLKDCL